jgi:hypothetical protein
VNDDNSVKIALIISAIFHGFLFFAFPAINAFFPKIPDKPLEITYFKFKETNPVFTAKKTQPSATNKVVKPQNAKLENIRAKIATQHKKNQIKPAAAKNQPANKNIPEPVKNDMVIPPLPKGVEKLPAYLDYVQSVRDKIKNMANSKYRHKYAYGEVLLSFVLNSTGKLAVVKIREERSCNNEELKSIAKESIEDASPFDPFPPDLEFKELSFSVVLSFE